MRRHLPLLTLALLAGSSSVALAQQTVEEGFDGGSNVGGWAWGTQNESIVPLNGNPGAYLQDLTLFTFQPTLTTGVGDVSPFTGDYAARGVTSLGVDLITLDKGFAVEGNRWVTLMLLDDAGTPANLADDRGFFFVGDTLVPDAGVPLDASAGWTAYDFDVEARSTSAPAGWQPIQFGAAGISWSALMADVDRVEFWYGPPDTIYLFDSWDVGADNLRLTEDPCQTDLGFGGPGDLTLSLCGDVLATGGVGQLTVTGATPFQPVYLALAAEANPTPFKGGTLVPLPLVLVLTVPADGAGVVSFAVPGGGGPFEVIAQAAAADPGQVGGFELSNAISAAFLP